MARQKQRIDDFLVEIGLAKDLAHARALILAGKVVTSSRKIMFPSEIVTQKDSLRVKGAPKFVGRGGDKLDSVLDLFGIRQLLKGKVVLDVGASTGGFTDCLIQSEVAKVIAIDVGYNQLAWKLRNNKSVIHLEKTDIKNCLICAQVAIAGSTKIYNNVIIGGQAGIIDNLIIEDNVVIGPRSFVIKSIKKNLYVSGNPARNHKDHVKQDILISKLPKIYKKVFNK